MTVTQPAIRQAIQKLNLSGQVLCVHSSLSSFGQVAGGAATILAGLLAEGCTVLVPTFTYDFAISPPNDPAMRPQRNGYDYTTNATYGDAAHIYTPNYQEVVRDMGALPAAVAAHSQRVRGNHALNSFAAIGPLAEELIAGQAPLDVYAPFRSLLAHHGTVIMMGIGLTRMTLIHYAEQQAGRTLFRRWANSQEGRVIETEVGSCSEGFGNFDTVFAPFERRVTVGESLWRVFDATAVVSAAVEAIQVNPHITHCIEEDCGRCNDAVMGGALLRST